MNGETENQPTRVMEDGPPPILRTWRRLYLALVCWLAFLILMFYLFARFYSS